MILLMSGFNRVNVKIGGVGRDTEHRINEDFEMEHVDEPLTRVYEAC